MIYYSEITKFKTNITGMVNLSLQDGKKYRFSGFPSMDRKAMPVIFEEAVDQFRELGFEPDCTQSRENACKHCFSVVPNQEFECPKCGATFWTPKEIAIRSFVFPAWGDILMKHYPLAVVEILGYLFSWIIAGGLFATGDYIAGFLVLLFVHTFDALVTMMIARKGLHTKRKPQQIAASTVVEPLS